MSKPQTSFTKSDASQWTREQAEQYGLVIDDETHAEIFDEVFNNYLKLGIIRHVKGDEYQADSDNPILKLLVAQDKNRSDDQ